MENISNEIIGYIALFAGVVIGWLLRGLWRSIKNRMAKSVIVEYKKGKRIWRFE